MKMKTVQKLLSCLMAQAIFATGAWAAQVIDCGTVKFVIDRTVPVEDCVYTDDPLHCTVVTHQTPGGYVYFRNQKVLLGQDLVENNKESDVRFTGAINSSGFIYFYLPKAVYGRASTTSFYSYLKGVAGHNFSAKLSCTSTIN